MTSRKSQTPYDWPYDSGEVSIGCEEMPEILTAKLQNTKKEIMDETPQRVDKSQEVSQFSGSHNDETENFSVSPMSKHENYKTEDEYVMQPINDTKVEKINNDHNQTEDIKKPQIQTVKNPPKEIKSEIQNPEKNIRNAKNLVTPDQTESSQDKSKKSIKSKKSKKSKQNDKNEEAKNKKFTPDVKEKYEKLDTVKIEDIVNQSSIKVPENSRSQTNKLPDKKSPSKGSQKNNSLSREKSIENNKKSPKHQKIEKIDESKNMKSDSETENEPKNKVQNNESNAKNLLSSFVVSTTRFKSHSRRARERAA